MAVNLGRKRVDVRGEPEEMCGYIEGVVCSVEYGRVDNSAG